MKHSQLARLGFILLFIVIGVCRAGAADFAKEYVVKAAIILNLARFTEWPESELAASSQYINLCVLGNEVMQQAFAQIEKKTSGSRLLHIVPMFQSSHLEQCNMIYVGGLIGADTKKILSRIAGQAKLSIGERNDFLEQGGMVNLEMKEGKINIQVNLDAATRSGIKISSRVLALTTIIHIKKAGNQE